MSTIWLIAKREMALRLRSKAFRITTAVIVIILVGLAVGGKLLGGGHSSALTVGVTPKTAAFSTALSASAASVGEQLDVSPVPDEATGRTEVRSGRLDALTVGDGRNVSVIIKQDLAPGLDNVLHVLARQLAFEQGIRALGGNPATIEAAISADAVSVRPLVPPHHYQQQQLALGILAGILIYIALTANGQMLAQGVVEEKSSRVVEILLAMVRPWQLMSGKVLGIGLVGLTQLVIIAGAGVAAGRISGSLAIPAADAASTVFWLIAWFLLGFFAYALAIAAAAALVSRQEDVATVVLPVLIFIILGYALGATLFTKNPGSGTAATLSMVPVFAPTLMPMRIAVGGVPAWQLAVSVAGMVAVIPLLIVIAGRIYRNAVVRTGARIKLRDAWRPA